jgi:hypothetical protein
MGQEIALRATFPDQNEMQMMALVAKNAATSGLYAGIGSEAKIFMIIMSGWELGISPCQALNGGLWNIKGKVEVSARLMNSMIRRAGHSIIVKECNAQGCVLEGKRMDNSDTAVASFSQDDAKRAGLLSSGAWQKHPEDMYFARAMSKLARRLFPDVIGTAYVEGELKDLSIQEYDNVNPEPVKINHILPLDEDVEKTLYDFASRYDDPSLVKVYIEKYGKHYGKSIADCLADFQDNTSFLSGFEKWKAKEKKA